MRFPLLRISFGHAVILSGVYLGLALISEVALGLGQEGWSSRILLTLESVPAQLLRWLGFWSLLEQAYINGQMDESSLRVILAATMLSVIFLIALLASAMTWLLKRMNRLKPSV